MKAKNILMTLLLAVGAIAAKASGYPPELALVSQPVMVYNHNSITVYYDVENIGDYTYRGDVYIYLDPDYGYYYAKEYVKVRPGRIKRIAIDIPAHSFDMHRTFTIMPYYEMGRELYSFTTFEYFEPVRFYWHGSRTEPWVVIHVEPCIRVYHRPASYRYYYDGYRPPMHAHGPKMPPPMDPMHHTYGYHHSIGGYPATHPEWSNNEMPKPSNNLAPSATVRPKENAGSMSSGSSNAPATTSGSSSINRPSGTTGSSSGSVSRPSSSSTSSSVSRPSTSGTSRPSSSSNISGSSTRPATNGSMSRPSSSSSSVSRPSGSTSRPSGTNSSSMSGSSSRTSNGSSARTSSSSSSTRSSGSSSARSSSSSNSSRGGASTSSATGSGRR